MLIKKNILRATGASLAAIALLTAQPLRAQSASDTARIEKLERAVEMLAKQNAELQAEVKSLKSKHVAPAPAAVAEGKTRTEVTSDGKTYVEKLVPELQGGQKWKLFPAITELELFGDVRLRYEYRGGRLPGDDPNNPNDWYEKERERYRLRLGLRGTVLDDWFFGVRLETSSSARSTNVTMGGDAGNGNGPFNKGDDGIAVGQAYLGYKGFPGTTLTGGRFAIPFVTTSLLWDDDINVEGLAEQWKHTFTFRGGPSAPASSSKDGKAVAPSPSEPFLTLDLFANFGQFVYDDSNPTNPIGARPTQVQPIGGETQLVPNTNAFLLGWQVGAKFNFPDILYFQLAPTLYNYTGNGKDFSIFFSGDPGNYPGTSTPKNQTGINSLLVFDIPAEIGWKVGKIPMRIFGDFATNFEADDRATAAGHPGKGGDRYAYEIGLGIGQLKKKRDWQVRAWWQHTDQYAVDPNLVDSDIFDSRLNLEGVGVKAGYMLADAIVLNLTYAYGWQVDDSIGTGGNGDIPINPLNQYQLFQADLSVNF
jgi:Putative porin